MSKSKLLIVEDEIVIAKDLQKKLSEVGYEAAAIASSGEKAIELSSTVKPDLVLMDIVLKGKMDGIETAEVLRSRYGIPVIYLTAYGDDATIDRAKITEPYGYILKPFDINMVKITIEMALYKHLAEQEKAKLLADLQEALAHVKTLRGLLPICAWCKKIRNDNGYWEELEAYVHEHSDAEFSHGICPECMEKYHNEYLERRNKKESGTASEKGGKG